MAFGITQKGLTKNLNDAIKYESVAFAGNSFVFGFSKNDRPGEKSYWRCTCCRKLYDSGNRGCVGSITIDNATDEILTDPDIGHHPECRPIPNANLVAHFTLQEQKQELRRGTKRPRQAYTDASANIAADFGADDMYNDIVDALPSYKKVPRQLHRNAVHGIVNVPDPANLPVEYQRTYLSRMNPAMDERWLLHGANGVLIFASQLDLQVLHDSDVWIMDGTFKVCPPRFRQLYTILGYGSFEREATPVVFALLNGKNQQIYEDLLRRITNAIRQQHGGDLGNVQTILVDFELAMHSAIRTVIPGVRMRGCLFHLGEAMQRHLEGLKLRDANQYNEIGKVFHLIKALSLLPERLVRMSWDSVIQVHLNNLLLVLSPHDRRRMNSFTNYFFNTWLNNAVHPIGLWNHSDNYGPRTTNHAEGYHSLLNKSDIDQMHPSLAHFLTKLQKMHNRWQQQIGRLQRGAATPEQGVPLYLELHNRILNARAFFIERTQQLWNIPQFDPIAMEMNEYQHLCREIDLYLNHIKYLIGKSANQLNI